MASGNQRFAGVGTTWLLTKDADNEVLSVSNQPTTDKNKKVIAITVICASYSAKADGKMLRLKADGVTIACWLIHETFCLSFGMFPLLLESGKQLELTLEESGVPGRVGVITIAGFFTY